MLLIDCYTTRAAKAGANIAEVKQVSTHVVQLSNGKTENRPVWGSVYLDGMPLGDAAPEIKAPIALETGDHLRVADQFPDKHLWDIERDGKVVWKNEMLQDEVAGKASDRDKVRAARRALE